MMNPGILIHVVSGTARNQQVNGEATRNGYQLSVIGRLPGIRLR